MRGLRVVAGVLALVLATSACSSSDDGGSPTTTITPTSAAAAAPTAGSVAPTGRRARVGAIDVPLPDGWTVVAGRDSTTMDGKRVRGADWACLDVSRVETEGIPFSCAGLLVLTGSAFDAYAEGSRPFDPDDPHQWYQGTDVPSCETAGSPLVRSTITASSLAPIGDKQAAFRRLDVGCEQRATVFRAVSWTLPVSRIALVSVFRGADAERIWAGARLA